MTGPDSPRDPTETAMVQLVRLVLDDAWTAPGAAASDALIDVECRS